MKYLKFTIFMFLLNLVITYGDSELINNDFLNKIKLSNKSLYNQLIIEQSNFMLEKKIFDEKADDLSPFSLKFTQLSLPEVMSKGPVLSNLEGQQQLVKSSGIGVCTEFPIFNNISIGLEFSNYTRSLGSFTIYNPNSGSTSSEMNLNINKNIFSVLLTYYPHFKTSNFNLYCGIKINYTLSSLHDPHSYTIFQHNEYILTNSQDFNYQPFIGLLIPIFDNFFIDIYSSFLNSNYQINATETDVNLGYQANYKMYIEDNCNIISAGLKF